MTSFGTNVSSNNTANLEKKNVFVLLLRLTFRIFFTMQSQYGLFQTSISICHSNFKISSPGHIHYESSFPPFGNFACFSRIYSPFDWTPDFSCNRCTSLVIIFFRYKLLWVSVILAHLKSFWRLRDILYELNWNNGAVSYDTVMK